jgi:hypothetical protein
LLVYPNPSNGVLFFEANGLELPAVYKISIHNLTGQKIYEGEFYLSTAYSDVKIDLSDHPGGSYILKIQHNQQMDIQLIILQ